MAKMSTRAESPDRGSMVAFWGVIGAAALLLIVYAALPKRSAGVFPGSSSGPRGTLISPEKRKPIPNFQVRRYAEEGALSAGDLAGRVAVLHIWATWCPPCRAEFPDFARYASGPGDGVEVIALSVDSNPAEIGPFARGIKEMPPVYLDPQGTLLAELGTTGIPETILVDAQGRIAYRASGVQDWGEGGVPRLVEQLLKEAG